MQRACAGPTIEEMATRASTPVSFTGLGPTMHVGMVCLLAASAARYFTRHGWSDRAPWVVGGAVVVLVLYLGGAALAPRRRFSPVVLVCVVAGWGALVLLAPSFGWCAFPLFFVCLRDLPVPLRWPMLAVVTGFVIASQTRVARPFDVSLVIGPVVVAVLIGATYKALLDESAERGRIINDLVATREDLARQYRAVGVAEERQRLAREIHDTIAQGLGSVLVLLQAVHERRAVPEAVDAQFLATARTITRENLAEARRFVQALGPAVLEGRSLEAALVELSSTGALSSANGSASPLTVEVEVVGAPVELLPPVEQTLIRVAQGALANIRSHAGATRARLTLTYLPDAVVLDVRDDGRGFDTTNGEPGFGLRSLAERLDDVGGRLSVESSPGDGTAVAASIPLVTSP